MKYIRTKDGIYNAIKEFKIGDMINVPYDGLVKIIKQADTIEDLIQEGDLVKYEDRTTSYPYQTTFVEITKFFKPHHTAIYRVVELYIKLLNGDYKLVAKDKGDYKLELV